MALPPLSFSGGSAAPSGAGNYGAPVEVTVGGLNVPAFPNFPVDMFSGVTGQAVSTPKDNTLLIAAGVVLVAVTLKKLKAK